MAWLSSGPQSSKRLVVESRRDPLPATSCGATVAVDRGAERSPRCHRRICPVSGHSLAQFASVYIATFRVRCRSGVAEASDGGYKVLAASSSPS